jgi:GT2 family glycosyltransferase
MISVIICSVNPQQLAEVSNNIEDTIGTPFEIVSIDNRLGNYGICAAYNLGASSAKGDILCFMHEDVKFETNNWGLLVREHLSKKNTGMIGVAGGTSKSLVPSTWSPAIFNSEINIIQHFKFAGKTKEHIRKSKYAELTAEKTEVVAIDGVWMCIRKEVFQQVGFDAENFKGFHGYDIDFSFQLFSHYKIYVVFDILLNHYSEGSFNYPWLQSSISVSRKWRHLLPVSVDYLSKEETVRQHWTCMRFFLNKSNELKLNRLTIFGYFLRYSANRMFNTRHFFSCMKAIIL